MTLGTKTLAMIMAGGQGNRLQPLTQDRAKPAVHYGGTYRIIDFVLNNFVNSGIFKIKILTQFKSDSLNKHISAAWSLNRSLDQYVDLVPAQMRTGQEWYRGTADAIFQNINLITDEKPDLVAVFGGDHIYKMDVNQLIEFHLSKAALLTIAAIPVPVSEASEFGIIEVDSDGRMVGFEEKPKQNPKEMPDRPGWCLASMGNYIFNSKFLVRELTAASKREGSFDFGKDIIPALYPDYPVYVYDFNTNLIRGESSRTKGYWRDVGTLEALYEANLDLCADEPDFDLYNSNWPIRTLNWNQPPAKFVCESNENIKGSVVNSVVSAGCILNASKVVRSVLSPGVHCEKESLIEESILFPDVVVGAGAKVRRAIIEKGIKIPPGYSIGYDIDHDRKLFTVTDSGIVVIAKATIIKG